MAQSNAKPSMLSRLIWVLIFVLILALGFAAWTIYQNAQRGQASEAELTTPEAGGLVVATAPTTATVASTGGITATTGAIVAASAPSLQPGQTVAASGADGLRMYTEPQLGSPVMDVYGEGALFTIVEPSGEYGTYPVVDNEREWYRLRAADGLVGWAILDALTPTAEAPVATSTPSG